MRDSKSIVCCALLLLNAGHAAPPGPMEPTRNSSRKIDSAQWSVRVEVLMVAMPQDKLLPLLPDLRDARKIDGAVDQILAAVQRKEAILTGYPAISMLDGDRSVSETILEKRYPTEFEPPETPQTKTDTSAPARDAALVNDSPMPSYFETRNLGVTLEAGAKVSARGDSIRVDVVPQRVELLGFEPYDATKAASGKTVKVDQPQFFTAKVNTSVNVQNGHRELIAVHLLHKPESYMEVFILQAWATPIK